MGNNYDYNEWYHAVFAYIFVIPILWFCVGVGKVWKGLKWLVTKVLDH